MLEHGAAVDVEFSSERHGERIIFGAIKEGVILFGCNGARYEMSVYIHPNMF